MQHRAPFRMALAVAVLAAVVLPSSAAYAASGSSRQGTAVLAAVTVTPDVAGPSAYPQVRLAALSASYTVRRGDTLSGIAARYCGRASAYRALAGASGIRNPDLIYPGQRITLRCAGTAVRAPAKASRSTATARTSSATGWVNPLPGVALTSCYGWRWGSFHAGLDMDGYKGQSVRAAASGIVMAAGTYGTGYGREVFIWHGNNTWTHYAHLNGYAVSKGQRVSAGQRIAYVGNSGSVVSSGGGDGSHLHFSIMRHSRTSVVNALYGSEINPAPYLRARGVKIGC